MLQFLVLTSTIKYLGGSNTQAYRRVADAASVLYEVEFANAVLVVLVHWFILYLPSPNPNALEFVSIVMHIFNVIFFVFDFFVNDLPIRPFSTVWQLLFAIIYAYFAWVFYSFTGL